MFKTKIPFTQLDSIPLLVKDFLNGNHPDFLEYRFSVENALKKAEAKSQSFSSEQRFLLCSVLEQQMQGLSLSEKQKEHLKSLLTENTFTVTTGHQLNLFTGPVFFIYKILQTIKTANFLSEKTNKHFVPVFWMATEDHDFEEINHFSTPANKYQMKGNAGGAVGRILVEDFSFVEAFEKEFGDTVFGTQLILLLKKAYQKGNTWAEATRILVHELFSEYGLLILDGDDAQLKEEMSTVFSKELKEQIVSKASEERRSFLANKYGKVQVNPREINLFYLAEIRDRITKNEEHYQLIQENKEFTFQEISSDWSKISPNALLRPVYQEKVLPNVAYVGGNAEIMYWLELPEVFKSFEIEFPLLIPRNSMVFLPTKTLHKISKSGIDYDAYFGDFQHHLNQLLLQDSKVLNSLNDLEKQLQLQFEELKKQSLEIHGTFQNMVEAEEKRQKKSFDRFKKRLLRAEKLNQADRLDFLQRLYQEIHPKGIWQERVYNFSTFFAEQGQDWIEKCYQEMDVEKSMLILMEF